MQQIKVVDTHTGGEPTRIIVDGGPDLGDGSLAERRERFQAEFDSIRSAVVNEPRGSDVLVGGLLCRPSDGSATAGVIFFNNTGFLGMCGHGTIGLMVTLRHLKMVEAGAHAIETPVGVVRAVVEEDSTVSVQNVESYRFAKDVEVAVPGYGSVVGDVAYGGNWFFLVKESREELVVGNVHHLSQVALDIRKALDTNGITGADGAWIDHIELFAAPRDAGNHSRNFVMCPGGAYDRSPCGTGTSAKLACLAADGKLEAGESWRQEGIVGSVFECSFEPGSQPDRIVPTIRGNAHVCGEATLILDPADPFCMGIRV